MKKGQTLVIDGVQALLFPMEYLNVTQGNNGSFSHRGVNALDNAGKDTGIDETICPCDCHLVAYDSYANGNAVFLESDNKVKWADGTVDFATMMFLHDNYIGDILQVKNFKQGWTFGDEGTAGFATGNHSHMEIAKGRFVRMYDGPNAYGTYCLHNSVSADKAFFIDGTEIINAGGFNFIKSNESQASTPTPSTPDQILSIGSKVKFTNGLRVEKYDPSKDLLYNSRIGGWISPSICKEDSANDGKLDDYFANTNATFTIEGTFTVGGLRKPQGVWIAYLNELGFWVNCEPLIELSN